jgi:RecB family exonuclease
LTAVPGLRALQRSIARLSAAEDPALARATLVLVSTRASAAELRRTLENLWLLADGPNPARAAVVFPDILTRADWYRRLAEQLAPEPRLLSEVEREALLAAAARDAVVQGAAPPFRMRPGLVAEMLRFYDGLRRQQKMVDDFERLVLEDLEPRAAFDRGAERLLAQTMFLSTAFRLFEARVAATGAHDEHGLRQRAIAAAAGSYRRLVVTVGDRVSDPSAGLSPADFDLAARVPGLESIDIVATRAALLAGLGERLRSLLPGIEEVTAGDSEPPPALAAPPREAGRLYFSSRDREEELRDVARRIKRELREAPGRAAPSVAVVFRRPLPYVYLGRTVFDAARIQWQASDALPLAAEPFAAALDQVFAAVTARFARRPLLELLRSPHFGFAAHGGDFGALDRALAEGGYLGDVERLRAFADTVTGPAGVAARSAVELAGELSPLGERAAVSAHLSHLSSFLRAHERLDAGDEEVRSRHLRARAAVLRILDDMRAAATAYDDPTVTLADLAALVRRWIESQTFTPGRGEGGVRLVDAQSARHGDFDRVHLVGLAAGDWPEASARDLFYPAFLLARLGWPPEAERLAAERAWFADLVGLARDIVSVSSFTLEDDAIVEPSPLLEDLETASLRVEPVDEDAPHRVFVDEALTADVLCADPLAPAARAWAGIRAARTAAGDARFHGLAPEEGRAAAAVAARRYTVTGIDRYLECPFKYFAASVLNLPEEPQDEQGMSPKERGRFVHEVLRAFFAEWQARGGGTIEVARLDAARALFAEVADQSLQVLPASEAALERLRLIGSVAAPGIGDVVLAAEAARPDAVSARLLEFAFDAEFEIVAGDARRRVRLRGKADRVDLLSDGRFRVIDYKIGRPPDESVQLPLYVVCLGQLFAREGREAGGAEALYVAFGDRRSPVQPVIGDGPKSAVALEEAQRRAIEAIEGIERGEFPPRPAAPRLCGYCAHAAVCRKEYAVAD